MKRNNVLMIAIAIAMIVILSGATAGCSTFPTSIDRQQLTQEQKETDDKIAITIDLIGSLMTDIIAASR